ncbi:MAG: helix-turn-helix domain-containing protein, partial [Alphaproteobacteria bacterium]|nr:helix-turn-helix domain-containing protein [Alphaproteobacteria bacterium]
PEYPTGDGFCCETRAWKLGSVIMSRTIGPRVRFIRTKNNIRRDPVDHWAISYCVRDGYLTKTGETEVEVPAGVPYLWSMGQESLSERPTYRVRMQIFLPRDAFRDSAPLLDATCGSALDTPLGRLLGDYMIALWRRLPDMTEADFAGLGKTIGAIAVAAVASSADRTAIAKPLIDLGRSERVRQVVQVHLRSPSLEPGILGRMVGMSRSNLYRLFEDTGGIARYIQRQRLLEARAILADPASTQTVTAIAEDFCFADVSSFRRAFKREFGYTPREARYAAVSGLDVTPKSRVPLAGAHFGDLLRGF